MIMCQEIVIDDVECGSMGQLRAVVGDFPLHDGYDLPIPDHSCLCPVDVEAMIQSGKFVRDTRPGDDPFIIYLKTVPSPPLLQQGRDETKPVMGSADT